MPGAEETRRCAVSSPSASWNAPDAGRMANRNPTGAERCRRFFLLLRRRSSNACGHQKTNGLEPAARFQPVCSEKCKTDRNFSKKQHEKTGEISRNLPFFVLFGLNCALWQGQKGSNPRPTVLETAALPAELYPCIKEAPAARTDRSEQNTIYYTQADTGCQEGSAVFFRQKIRQKSCKFSRFVI